MSTPVTSSRPPRSTERRLDRERLLHIHALMLEGRVLEERLIRMQRQGEGYFWIGGPGEEAFNTVLGLQMKKGQGLDYDYLHGHYRSSGTLLALGAPSIDALRQMHNTKTDPYSQGRNFVGHFSKREWNIVPITSPIEVQYSVSIGTAYAQRRHGGTGITIVQGGDAGSAEGDFATCLVWSSRPGAELPILIIVTNNRYGISTPAETQHGEKAVSDRGKPFGLATGVCDGNDPEASWFAIQEAMDYVRSERKPFVLQANLSRLYGHSSSSGSNYVETEVDCLDVIGDRLHERGWRSHEDTRRLREQIETNMRGWYEQVLTEPKPEPEDAWDYVFADKNYVGGEA
ncbi:MAG: thiamine pyrophosphate-dependent dehydrogenase E1 component subunit alpha [Myxococcales bacterium]|nr:thiamine pyrophosphate-dependent dehydrogenase E1 component subunit alpha [Myxococcales bacterium]